MDQAHPPRTDRHGLSSRVTLTLASTKHQILSILFIAGFASATDVVLAAPVSWVDWTTFEAGFTDGTAAGTANDGGLTVTYSGEVYNLQTQVDGTGTDWWAPDSTWADGSTIDNAPPGTDIIALRGNTGSTNTITFSQPVTNPFMAVFSLGSPIVTDVTYNFDSPFDVIVGGANSAFGGSSVVEQDGNILSGIEGNGTIMFLGTYTSISFTVPNNESWHGFTIGVQQIPVPAAVWLFGSGLLGLIGIARRKQTNRV